MQENEEKIENNPTKAEIDNQVPRDLEQEVDSLKKQVDFLMGLMGAQMRDT